VSKPVRVVLFDVGGVLVQRLERDD